MPAALVRGITLPIPEGYPTDKKFYEMDLELNPTPHSDTAPILRIYRAKVKDKSGTQTGTVVIKIFDLQRIEPSSDALTDVQKEVAVMRGCCNRFDHDCYVFQ